MQKFHALINRVEAKLKIAPPGEDYQLKMAPAHRKPVNEYLLENTSYRLAAVMALLVPLSENDPGVILIERSVYDGVHSGQIALPGGKPEQNETLEETALRELNEETGIKTHLPRVIGKLSPLYIPPSNFLVHPFVAALSVVPEFSPQEREVQRIFTMPLSELHPSRVLRDEMITSEGFIVEAPFFMLDNGNKIWGATAMILSELFAAVQA